VKKKLIEVALPLEDINREAAREKSIRHGHPSTLHLWWARRPLAACRAVLFASLVDDPSGYVPELMADPLKVRAAEKTFAEQRSAWKERKLVADKAKAAGMTKVPEPGLEPKVGEIIEEQERERLFDIIRELVKWDNSNDERVLLGARSEIARSLARGRGETAPEKPAEVLAYLVKNAPPVYDPFCGGGSIPLEAQRLGLEAHGSDLNPVPVLITKALIEIPPKFAGKPPVNPESRKKFGNTGTWKGAAGLAEDIRYYGQWMRDEAEKRIGHLYPKVAVVQEKDGSFRHASLEEIKKQNPSVQNLTVIAWLWARTVASPDPAAKGGYVPLVRSFWLFAKPDQRTWVEAIVDKSTMTYRFEIRGGKGEPRTGTVSRNGGRCLLTDSPVTLEYVRAEGRAGRLGTRLLAIVAEGPNGRIYLPPNEAHELSARCASPQDLADTDLPEQALGFRVQNYGMKKHRQLFTNRQLTALATFCDLVGQIHARVLEESDGDKAYGDAVATYLGMCASKAAVFYTTLARWRTGEGKSAPAFGRQAVSMVWDFTEVNPFAGAGGDFAGIVDGAMKTIAGLPASPKGFSFQADAARTPDLRSKPMFSTDPPYYDNVPYADLSDYFYVWLRRAIQPVYPGLLGTVLVPKAEELVADPFRHGGNEKARAFFERGMGRVFKRLRQAGDSRFPTTIYYAFKQAEDEEAGAVDIPAGDDEREALLTGNSGATPNRASTGWETFLQGLVDADWQIDGTWPMRTEGSTRMRSMASNALASSIVLVCRPRLEDAGVASRRDLLASLKQELPDALRRLQKGNIAPVDLAQAAIGPGMAVFSRFARVLETDGSPMNVRTALALINQMLDEVLAEQEGEFDADTRWALAWFDQFGFSEGPYGQAETLSTAKNTSVAGMVEAGILTAKGGKVRLLKKEELLADWDPRTDTRFTIWEATHYLVRSLDKGEQGAADLLHRLGPIAETARDLSYRLYTICERRKWSQDALGYNSLVLAWSDVQRLVGEMKATAPTQGEMSL